MTSDPIGMHDWHSEGYVRDWVERQQDEERQALLRRLAYLIPFDPDDEIRVLDIGGGYGAVTSAVLDAFPRALVTLHDYSEPMLDEARGRLAHFSDSVSFVRGDLMTPDWTEGLTGQFHAVVSSIAIHNVRFPERIRAIYQEVFPFVLPGGCFLNLDLVTPAGDLTAAAERHAGLMAERHRMYEARGEWTPLSEVESLAAAERLRIRPTQPIERISSAEPATLANQLRWLTDSGFSQADCFWRDGRRAIMGAFREPFLPPGH